MATLTSNTAQRGKQRLANGAWAAGTVIIFLYASLFKISDYVVTIGGTATPIVLFLSFRKIKSYTIPILLGMFFTGWPLLIMLGSIFFSASLTPEFLRFLTSYALWVVSILLLTTSFLTESAVRVRWIFPIQVILITLMAIQFIGARLFSSMIGFEIVAPLIASDIFNSYLGLSVQSTVRAIGTYYEPSMCARVIGTLCFLDMMQRGRIAWNIVVLGLTMIFTQSLGLVVMAAAFGIILLGRSWREFGLMVFGGGLLAIVALPIVSHRSNFDEGSSYVRVIAPIETVEWAITHNALGLPIGSMENLAAKTGFTRKTGELKITNGIYEFMIYFGFLGIGIFIVGGSSVLLLIAKGERELAMAILYIIISTGLSGSFLSIESSLLSYFFVVGAIEARRERLGVVQTRPAGRGYYYPKRRLRPVLPFPREGRQSA